MAVRRRKILGIILASSLFRALGLFRPLLGNFAIYQTAQAMIAKFFVEDHFTTLLYPKLNLLADGQPSLMLLYYPVCSLVTALLAACFGGEYGVWGRFQAIVFFALSAWLLFRFVRRLESERMAFGALIFFVLCPLTIIYGQSFQSEMAVVFFTLLFFHQLLNYVQAGSFAAYGISALALSGVLLVRPNCGVFIVPAVYLAWTQSKEKKMMKALLTVAGLFLIASVLPALWFLHVWRLSETAPNIYGTVFAQIVNRSSFLSSEVFQVGYYASLFDSMTGVVLTPLGFSLFLFGLFVKWREDRAKLFFILWSASFLLGSLVIPRKLIDQNFFLLHFALPLSPLIAGSFFHFYDSWKEPLKRRKVFLATFLLTVFLVSLRYAANPAFKTPREEKNILFMAEELKKLTQKSEARVVTQAHHGFLYYADRYGWSFNAVYGFGEKEEAHLKYGNWRKLPEEEWRARRLASKDPIAALEYFRKYEKATHFVVVDPQALARTPEFASYLNQHYRLIYQDADKGSIFNLSQKQ